MSVHADSHIAHGYHIRVKTAQILVDALLHSKIRTRDTYTQKTSSKHEYANIDVQVCECQDVPPRALLLRLVLRYLRPACDEQTWIRR